MVCPMLCKINFLSCKAPQLNETEHISSPTITGDDYQILKRLMVLSNIDSTRIKPVEQPIPIPDLKPGENATVTANLDARYFEGTHKLVWDIQTEDGTSCFPNKADNIAFEVTVKNNL